MLSTFVRVTLAVAAVLLALVVVAFVFKLVVLGAVVGIVAALVVGIGRLVRAPRYS